MKRGQERGPRKSGESSGSSYGRKPRPSGGSSYEKRGAPAGGGGGGGGGGYRGRSYGGDSSSERGGGERSYSRGPSREGSRPARSSYGSSYGARSESNDNARAVKSASVVPAHKLKDGIVQANKALNTVIQSFAESVTGPYDITGLEATVSFDQEGKFIGFGEGGAASFTLSVSPSELEEFDDSDVSDMLEQHGISAMGDDDDSDDDLLDDDDDDSDDDDSDDDDDDQGKPS